MKHLNQSVILLLGILIGSILSPWFSLIFAELTNTTATHSGYRVPEMKIDLSSKSEVMIWKSVLPPTTNNSAGLAMHRHNYARVLIPLTSGILQRRDADKKTTDYALTPGKPILLPVDTAQGFHTDENLGETPIEVIVVQFNQSSPVVPSALTEEDIKASFGRLPP